jgi:hypothetical protein
MGLFREIRAIERSAHDRAPSSPREVDQCRMSRPQHCVHAQLLDVVTRKHFANRSA